jgi:hypothetical protein
MFSHLGMNTEENVFRFLGKIGSPQRPLDPLNAHLRCVNN